MSRWQSTQLSAEAAWCFRDAYQWNAFCPCVPGQVKGEASWAITGFGKERGAYVSVPLSVPARLPLSFLPSSFYKFSFHLSRTGQLIKCCIHCEVPVQLIVCKAELEPGCFLSLEQEFLNFCAICNSLETLWSRRQGTFIFNKCKVIFTEVIPRLALRNI